MSPYFNSVPFGAMKSPKRIFTSITGILAISLFKKILEDIDFQWVLLIVLVDWCVAIYEILLLFLHLNVIRDSRLDFDEKSVILWDLLIVLVHIGA